VCVYAVVQVGVDLKMKDRRQLLVVYLRQKEELEQERRRCLTRLLVCETLSY
jgi:hypothetical protein